MSKAYYQKDGQLFPLDAVHVVGESECDHTIEDGLVSRTLTEYSNDRVTEVGAYAFNSYSALTKLNLPNMVKAGPNWASGTGLVHINFPNWEWTGGNDFRFNSTLVEAILPKLHTVPNLGTGEVFEKADLFGDTSYYQIVGSRTFQNFAKLKAVIIRRTVSVVELLHVNAFTGSGVELGTGYIYVPKALVEEYKAATNWVTYASQIRAIEDYPEITGGAK